MPTTLGSARKNSLLRLMPPGDMKALYPHFEWVNLHSHEVLNAPEQRNHHFYFPVTGVYSVLARGNDGAVIESGLIGREGMVGTSLCLGVTNTPFDFLVQVPGRCIRIPEAPFMERFHASAPMRSLLMRYLLYALVQTAQTALANGTLTVQQRLARWLLMCQDRLDAEEFMITHDFLASTLAVRRPMVTVALQTLEGHRAIRSTRGKLKILDRALLENIAGSAYGVAESEYLRLLVNPQFEEQVPAGPRARA